MSNQDKPMPLRDLPAYLDSVRERGQGDDIPVVDMGMIVDAPKPFNWSRAAAYSAAACLMVAVGVAGYAAAYTRSITIAAGEVGPQQVAEMVSQEGGRVFSVKKNEQGDYEVKVFTFQKMSAFLDRLRENKNLEGVEVDQ